MRSFPGVLSECGHFWSHEEPHADQVRRGIIAGIARVAHRVSLALAAVRTKHFDFVPSFSENKMGITEYAPLESNRPARNSRDCRIGDYDCHSLPPLGVDYVRILQAH